ncbi:MAG: Glu-tRNA(Gln) amidotransferase subunit GatE [Candidatus Micrarchaeota archaeon]
MKVGIEIHQRLDSDKLFCNCPSLPAEGTRASVYRKQRAVAGELGKVDVAAAQEFMRKRRFLYEAPKNSSCLVESDDEPPHGMNERAVEIAIEICLLLEAKIVDEMQVMRKTVIDGSNTGGFQRTAIIGLDGKVRTSKGEVGIMSICIEEESSGIIGEENGVAKFSLDRLGMPLIEIATDPTIVDGEHAQEVAEKLGAILRTTGKVQRGIGTIRQDLNVSIEGGARVEIKGAQELKLIRKMVETEAVRQKNLIAINEEIEKRFGGKPKFEGEIVDLTSVFSSTESKLLKKVFELGGKALGLRLEKLKGLLGMNLCEGRRFGTELSDYAKAESGVGGLIHSDEDFAKYAISEGEWGEVGKNLSVGPDDGFVIVADSEEKAKIALEAVRKRAMSTGVPKETRRALPDGCSAYMRPLPGSARLYPETDVPPVRITAGEIERIKKMLPPMPDERLRRLEARLGKELAKKIFNTKEELVFELVVNTNKKVEPQIVAVTLQDTVVNLRREGVKVDLITVGHLQDLFVEYSNGLFVKAAIPEILKHMSLNLGSTCEETVGKLGLKKASREELKKIIEEEGEDFGKIMKKHRLRVDAKEVKEIIGK